MWDFKGRHFEGEMVLWAVRWYCRYGISYRDLQQMMSERGVFVEHSTIYLYGRLSRCKAILIWAAWPVANIYPASPEGTGRPNGESARARLYSW